MKPHSRLCHQRHTGSETLPCAPALKLDSPDPRISALSSLPLPNSSASNSTTSLFECSRRLTNEREKKRCGGLQPCCCFRVLFTQRNTTNAAALNSLVKSGNQLECNYNHKQATKHTRAHPRTHTHTHTHTHAFTHTHTFAHIRARNHTTTQTHTQSRNMVARSSHSSVTLLGATRTPRLSAHLK